MTARTHRYAVGENVFLDADGWYGTPAVVTEEFGAAEEYLVRVRNDSGLHFFEREMMSLGEARTSELTSAARTWADKFDAKK